jgi:hypothetical protein
LHNTTHSASQASRPDVDTLQGFQSSPILQRKDIRTAFQEIFYYLLSKLAAATKNSFSYIIAWHFVVVQLSLPLSPAVVLGLTLASLLLDQLGPRHVQLNKIIVMCELTTASWLIR